jgi:hypothetical protein
MPHVASQMWAGQLERPDVGHRRAVTLSAKSLDFQRPPTTPPRRPRKMSNAESVPSLSLLMPENQPWDFGSIRHIRQPSHGTPPFTPRTPFSSVDSIFDLPSGVSAASSDTPISSTQSSFVAELEDTSQGLVPKPLSPRRKSQPTAASYIKELQSPAFSVSIPITLLLVSWSSSCNSSSNIFTEYLEWQWCNTIPKLFGLFLRPTRLNRPKDNPKTRGLFFKMSALNHTISSDRLSTSGWSQRTLNLPESLTFPRPIEVELDFFK